VSTQGPAITAPVWLRLVRADSVILAFYRKNTTDGWTELGTQSLAMASTVGVGLAVTSHADGTLATAAFSNVTIAPPPSAFTPLIIGGGGGGFSPDDATRTYT